MRCPLAEGGSPALHGPACSLPLKGGSQKTVRPAGCGLEDHLSLSMGCHSPSSLSAVGRQPAVFACLPAAFQSCFLAAELLLLPPPCYPNRCLLAGRKHTANKAGTPL